MSELSTNNFYLRPGESYHLQKERPGLPESLPEFVRVYIVALVETPPIPFSDEQGLHDNHRNQTVIAAEVYPTAQSGGEYRIGWVNLGPDEKKMIGYDLLEKSANNGEWFYLVLDTRKHQ